MIHPMTSAATSSLRHGNVTANAAFVNWHIPKPGKSSELRPAPFVDQLYPSAL